ncbi:major facilitator superfamily domain-containing protein [Dactylonectria macrodidyma]|uniref:Major facilitator superfamily domain-containing protein n=1 Tax=Dactylonectria macrodidyma TaxID=307937 RepID=A0A9P9E7I8_9HYPO|nr:major facilitator superfamily domain-containing protein [Dactylonectria macrodidyma]
MAQEKGTDQPPQFESSSMKGVIINDVSTYEAINLNREALDSDLTPEEARALRWKIDLRLMPLLCITYALQAIDKNTLSYAAVFGIREETNLQGTDYSWISAIFYLGYMVSEFPSNLLLQRLPINRVMSATVILWGAILMCHGAAPSFGSLAAVRTLLGVFESAIQPGTMLLFTMYYTREEQPFRFGIWIGSSGVGYILAGIASFGIGHVEGALSSWRVLFIIWGSITVAWGIFCWIALPGTPMRAKFLTQRERSLVVGRVKDNGTGIENRQFKFKQFREAMLDLKTWFIFFFAVCSNSPNGGLSAFQGLIIKGAGFSTLRTTLLQMPSGAVQLVACLLACHFATRYSNCRILIMLIAMIPFLGGLLGLRLLSQDNSYGRLACLWVTFCYTAAGTLSMSVAIANTAGHTKKITTNAMLLIGYCIGNFIGPFFFKTEQAPLYPLGVGMMFFCLGIQVLCLTGIWILLWSRNRSRADFHARATEERAWERGLLDETDLENKYFKYVY